MSRVKFKKTNKIDMLNGGLFGKIMLFAVTLAATSMLQQLFNSVDIAVVGHFADSSAQAAVGCNASVINLMINLFVGISVGANVVIANYIGKNETDKIPKAIHTSIVVAVVSGVAVMICGVILARPILEMMNTPSNVIDQAVTYLTIYFIGMPFIMLYNFCSAILRSMGDTQRPLASLIISGFANTGLNLLFVIVFRLGAAGVAIGTVIANMISSSLLLFFLFREKEPFKLSVKQLKIEKAGLIKILKVGIPAGLQGVVFSLSNVFAQTTVNGFGSDAVAGSAVTLNYECLTYFVVAAFAQTAVTFTSQNFGAGKFDRCKKIFRICMISSMIITAAMSCTIIAGRNFFIYLLTDEANAAKYAEIRMIFILTLNFIMSTYEVGGAALRGIGYSMTPAMITVFGTCVFRLLWIFAVCPMYPKIETLFLVYPISWIITGASVLIVYFIIRKRVFTKNLKSAPQQTA